MRGLPPFSNLCESLVPEPSDFLPGARSLRSRKKRVVQKELLEGCLGLGGTGREEAGSQCQVRRDWSPGSLNAEAW